MIRMRARIARHQQAGDERQPGERRSEVFPPPFWVRLAVAGLERVVVVTGRSRRGQ
jgi:hypothetical protein